jgi:hypothetical protein
MRLAAALAAAAASAAVLAARCTTQLDAVF